MNSETVPDIAGPTAGAGIALDALLGDPSAATVASRLGSAVTLPVRVSEPLLPLVAAVLHRLRADGDRPGLSILVGDDDEARELAEAIRPYLDGVPVAYLPHRGAAWGSPLPPAVHLVGERARALDVLARGGVVAVSADALVERIPPRSRRAAAVAVAPGDVVDRDELLAALAVIGYERTAGTVDERGQMAVRGDVVDIFPTTGSEPIRVELFGDEVERVSAFSALTQRSLRDLGAIAIYPAAEALDDDPAAAFGEEERVVPRDLVPVVPELLAAGPVIAWEARRVREACQERLSEVATGPHRAGYLRPEEAEEAVAGAHPFDQVPQGQGFAFEGQRPALPARGIAEVENELRAMVRQGFRVVLSFPHPADAVRTAAQLKRVETVIARPRDRLPDDPGVVLVASRLRRGLVSPSLRLAVLPSAQVLRRRGTDTSRIGRAIRSFTDLRPGDYVVHEDHGIGRFSGFDTKTVGGVTRDYLCLDFRGEDKLFVPHEQIAKVSRYIGADAHAPALSKLGGRAWDTLKARARHAVHELAGELLALYAARQAAVKEPVAADGELIERLEAAFPYAETDDQARAIDAVKEDLEAPRPMDRLICGDVGFGKTEVAVRASMKMVESGRQVMMLCPTTILAQQHLATFHDRFRDLPVNIEAASRFRAAGELKEAIARFREGRVDVLIGTHRILSRDVVPANLGLVVVDEEQRFGVAQKELLRQLRTEVDVLALSATPIPRSLHMSLSGLRDISVIATPPRGRRPIRTHVGEWDPELVAHAIRRELARNGQTFYLHNRVESIEDAAERLRGLVPEARIGVAHGQMSERQLERTMEQFLRGDHDVLCATTIIESGLDIPAAGTLVIERADLLGLSQLYQIRGRVGRSELQSHAYLFYPDAGDLTPEAGARLAALADYTELGSGFRVAMRDLELRGAGNLLGDEQSGHVAAVGFELYCELLAEAVAELQGAAAPAPAASVRIDAAIDAYVPAAYVGLEAAKIDVHRRIALASSEDDLRELEAELADRFGPVPEPVANLIGIQAARLALAPLGPIALVIRRDRVTVAGIALGIDEARSVREAVEGSSYSLQRQELHARVPTGLAPMGVARNLLASMLEIRGAAVAAPT